MNSNDARGCLETKWRDYLKERGHRVSQEAYPFLVLTSRDGTGRRYRWLLVAAEGSKVRLSQSCRTGIQYHLRQAKAQKETAYLVAGFLPEPRRIVVVPAGAALQAKCIRSDKGGIAWDD